MTHLQEKIELILQQEDIEGFIELGAPNDEYTSEAEHISAALSALEKNQFTEENIIGVISVIWAKNFNLPGAELELRTPAIRRVATQILQKI